jgi:polysaccharide export outer membrane protein
LKKLITGPLVTVIVATINGQRIYILGEVTRAGAYLLLPGMNVLQALSSAGGFAQFANIKNICLLRQENGQQVKSRLITWIRFGLCAQPGIERGGAVEPVLQLLVERGEL